MAEYTPTTEEIREYIAAADRVTAHMFSPDAADAVEAFDRWLAAHDAEVRAGAIAEEPELEWGVARERFPSSPAYYERDREACERFIENPPVNLVDRHGPWLILRRAKAGPWVPVKQEQTRCPHDDVDYQTDYWVCRTCGHREDAPPVKQEGAET